MADTLTANIAETVQPLIASTIALMPQKAPIMNLVTKKTITKGHDRIQIPRVNSVSTVSTPTEGDEVSTSSQFDLTSTTIQPTHRVIMVRVHERATYFSAEDLIAYVSEELSQTQAQDIDTDLSAEFTNFGTANDVGGTQDLTVAVLRQARRLLLANTRANGGPAPMPIYGVIHPFSEEQLLNDMGARGVVTNASPWIPAGLSETLIQNYFIPQNQVVGVTLFRDGYMTVDGSSNYIGAMFSQKALWLAIAKDWDMRTFEVPNWIGPIIRCVADYNSGIGAYPLWGCQITSDNT